MLFSILFFAIRAPQVMCCTFICLRLIWIYILIALIIVIVVLISFSIVPLVLILPLWFAWFTKEFWVALAYPSIPAHRRGLSIVNLTLRLSTYITISIFRIRDCTDHGASTRGRVSRVLNRQLGLQCLKLLLQVITLVLFCFILLCQLISLLFLLKVGVF